MTPKHAVTTSKLRVETLEDRAVPAVLFVDDDLVQVPTAKYTTIQAAVNAAKANDTIRVADGVYREQVTVSSKKDGLTIRAINTGMAVIEVPAVTVGDSLVALEGADDVTLRGFTLRGPLSAGTTVEYGVTVDGGSATIANNTITDIRNNPLDGEQTGFGVFVYGADSHTHADIRDNTFARYQKGGILVYGKKASADIEGNTLTGAGPTGLIAQNGIQVSGKATADIEDNTISGHRYTGPGFVATGISIEETDGVEVEGNRISGNDVAVDVANSRRTEIEDNIVTGNVEGIQISDSRDVEVEDNLITDTGNTPPDGAQIGHGIIVSGSESTTTVEIRGNTLARYQKGGILVVGAKASADIEGNTLDGGGPTGVIARNGIQVSDGATADIEDNLIFGHAYTGPGFVAAGISVDGTSGVEIEDNRLTGNDVGAYVSNSTKVEVAGNRAWGNSTGLFVIDSTKVAVTGNRVWGNTDDGIGLVNVAGGEVSCNRVWGNAVDGIYLEGSTRVEVRGNRVTDNGRDGLVLSAGSSNNTISGNELDDNGRFDAFDDTIGTRTGGTANWWFCNDIGTKNRPGLR